MDSIVFGPIRWCVWSFRPSSPLRLPHLKFLFVCFMISHRKHTMTYTIRQTPFSSNMPRPVLLSQMIVCLIACGARSPSQGVWKTFISSPSGSPARPRSQTSTATCTWSTSNAVVLGSINRRPLLLLCSHKPCIAWQLQSCMAYATEPYFIICLRLANTAYAIYQQHGSSKSYLSLHKMYTLMNDASKTS